MSKNLILSTALIFAACGGPQTGAEAHAAQHTEQAEADVEREEQETEAAEADAERAREVEAIIEENDDEAVLEAGEIVEAN